MTNIIVARLLNAKGRVTFHPVVKRLEPSGIHLACIECRHSAPIGEWWESGGESTCSKPKSPPPPVMPRPRKIERVQT